jgi:hypothetical protein
LKLLKLKERVMRKKLFLCLLLIFSHFAWADTVPCGEDSYYCLDPNGREFATVGPITMWYSDIERGCMPGSYSKQDACEQIAQACNRAHPHICQGDCLPGRSVTTLSETCIGMIPAAPPTTEYEYNMQVYP